MKQGSESNRGWLKWLSGAAIGTVAMYMFDPDRGRRRRALARDKLRSLSVKTGDAIEVAGRDLGNRLGGLQAQFSRMFAPRHNMADDRVVAARVRAKLGRVVSHPHAVEVAVQQGRLSLSGSVAAEEKPRLLDCVQAVPGVSAVEDRLTIQPQAQDQSAEQRGGQRPQALSESQQENWVPALRAVAMAGGSALGVYGLARRTPGGLALAALGLSLFARGMSNKPLKRLAGTGAPQRPIELQKTIEINAPPEAVYDLWSKYENFPRFMSHVLEVRDLGQQRSHWVVQGPAGSRLEWNAVLTEQVRPAVLAWRSEPGAAVDHTGWVRFEPAIAGTRVTVKIAYHPPAGALGQGFAALLGRDPKRELDDDLMRMKNFIETGIPPRDAAKPESEPGPFLH